MTIHSADSAFFRQVYDFSPTLQYFEPGLGEKQLQQWCIYFEFLQRGHHALFDIFWHVGMGIEIPFRIEHGQAPAIQINFSRIKAIETFDGNSTGAINLHREFGRV